MRSMYVNGEWLPEDMFMACRGLGCFSCFYGLAFMSETRREMECAMATCS